MTERSVRRLEGQAAADGVQPERALADGIGHPRPVVVHLADERAVGLAVGAHHHASIAIAAAKGAVLDRVLDQRLQDERRDGGAMLKEEPGQEHRLGLGRHVPRQREGAAVASLEDLAVALQPRHLLVQGLHLARLLDSVAEQIAQAREQPPRLAGLLGHQPGDGVERVEQEVRLEVGAQTRELGLAAQARGLEGAHASCLHRERVREGQRPEAEIHLRAEHAEHGRAHQAHAVRKVQAKGRDLHRDGAVGQPVDAAERGRDGHADGESLRRGEASHQRSPEGHREREHEQGQLGAHVDEAGDEPRAFFSGDRVVHQLQRGDTEDDDHPDGQPRLQDAGDGGRSAARRRG